LTHKTAKHLLGTLMVVDIKRTVYYITALDLPTWIFAVLYVL